MKAQSTSAICLSAKASIPISQTGKVRLRELPNPKMSHFQKGKLRLRALCPCA